MTENELPNYTVNVAKLPKLGTTTKHSIGEFKPQDGARAAIVNYLEVMSIEELSAKLVFRPWARDGVQVEGEVKASLHTHCPITTEGVRQDIEASFNVKYVPETSKMAKPKLNEDGELILEVDGDDAPEVFEGEILDAWAIILEHLALEIDLFARVEGAEFVSQSSIEAEEEESISPFAMLKSLKK